MTVPNPLHPDEQPTRDGPAHDTDGGLDPGPDPTAITLSAGHLPPPERIGRFEILDTLGTGGFGVVYLARDPALDRLVALKVPRPEILLTDYLRQRFLREGQIAADLDHPNIIPVHEAGEADGVCYLASAYCPGVSLARWLRQRREEPVALREAAQLVASLADAVHYAHQRGVIHRDLKPANILLGNREQGTGNKEEGNPTGDSPWASLTSCSLLPVPYITDFGLAKLTGTLSDADTMSGAVLGTPAYMSPEQAAGRTRDVGTASDIYALGVVLYECLAGRTPFRDDDAGALLHRVIRDAPPPPRLHRPDVPRDLETVCLKCLRKEPEGRYASAAELAADLRRWLDGVPVEARRHGPLERLLLWRRRDPRQAAAVLSATAALLALAVVGVWFLIHAAETRGQLRAGELRLQAERREREAAQKLAETREFYRLFTQVKERAATRPIGWTWDNLDDLRRAAALSPAAEHAVALRSQVASCLSATDLRPRATAETIYSPFQAAFSPDGKLLALAQGIGNPFLCMHVTLVDPASGKTVRVLKFSQAVEWQGKHKRAEASRALVFSPDGRWLVVGTRSGALHRWDLTRPDEWATTWQAHDAYVHRLAFDARGEALYSLATDGVLRRWHPGKDWKEGRAPGTRPVTDLTGASKTGAVAVLGGGKLSRLGGSSVPTGAVQVTLCPAGTKFAVAHARALHLYSFETGRHLATLADAAETYESDQIAFSPDGSLLAAASDRHQRLQVWELAGGRLLVDVRVPGCGRGVAFSPDGRTLAVVARERAFVYKVRRGDEQRVVARHPGVVQCAALADGGRTLVCLGGAAVGGQNEVSLWALDSCTQERLACWLAAEPARGDGRLAVGPDRRCYYTAGLKILAWDLSAREPAECGPIDEARGMACTAAPAKLWVASRMELRAAALGRDQPPGAADLKRALLNIGIAGRAAPHFASLTSGQGWALAGRDDGNVTLLDAATGKVATSRTLCKSGVTAVAIREDGRRALVGTELGKVQLLALPSLDVVKELRPHGDAVTAVGFAAGGLLVTAGRDRTVRLAGPEGEELLTLAAPGPIRSLACSYPSSLLGVVVEGERAVRLWDLPLLARCLADLGLGIGRAELDTPPVPPEPSFRPSLE